MGELQKCSANTPKSKFIMATKVSELKRKRTVLQDSREIKGLQRPEGSDLAPGSSFLSKGISEDLRKKS